MSALSDREAALEADLAGVKANLERVRQRRLATEEALLFAHTLLSRIERMPEPVTPCWEAVREALLLAVGQAVPPAPPVPEKVAGVIPTGSGA